VRCSRSDGVARGLSLGLAAVALLALAGPIAGCGNEKRDFREEKLNPLVKRASEERATLATILRASRPGRSRDEAALRAQLTDLGGVFRRIADLEPPDGVEAKLERYARANSALLRALAGFLDAFASGDEAGQRRAGQAAQEALARANRAQRELQRSLR
jgi:hypothetical protein